MVQLAWIGRERRRLRGAQWEDSPIARNCSGKANRLLNQKHLIILVEVSNADEN
ncbi:hypothetical protein [Scytonema sp. PCC 10023]|uniref:hypothetical protein n=1 Tax=Scytonema sp. PCC 10023 TaxID=1680591 RepID=UPI0039C6BE01